jgi:hypothetical protein
MVNYKIRNSAPQAHPPPAEKFEIRSGFRQWNFALCSLALVYVVFTTHCLAQDVQATARVDSNNIIIGDWLTLHLEVQHPENVSIDWRSLPDSLNGFEIVKRESLSVKKGNQRVLESSSWTITAFDSGMHLIPSLQFHYFLSGNKAEQMTETSPIPIFVQGIAVDTTQEIKDVKPPLSVPISLSELLPYIIGVLVVGGLIWLIYYIRKKRKRGESLTPEAPPRPPHEIALEALRSLEAERLWQRGKIKEYYSQLTDIVRLYIERRFGVLALESTTDEILDFTVIRSLPNDVKENLKEVLIRADLVKFAKFQPVTEEHETSLSKSRVFVESTWRLSAEPVNQKVADEVKV